jgi:predicted RNA-binding protein with PUA-like domain
MSYWLLKSEPGAWSWKDQWEKKTTAWDGVRNYQAANNLKAMKIGDLAFFYHSVSEKSVVGIVKVIGAYRPDPTDETHRFGLVDVEAVCPFMVPVTLAQIKAHPELQNIALVRQSRLSVMPLTQEEWQIVCTLGRTNC